jgi:hypothetical protein
MRPALACTSQCKPILRDGIARNTLGSCKMSSDVGVVVVSNMHTSFHISIAVFVFALWGIWRSEELVSVSSVWSGLRPLGHE